MAAHIDTKMPFADYLAYEAFGSSALNTFKKGPPAMVPWRNKNPSADTPSTRLGTAAHCLILTPELFALEYAIKADGMNFSTKEGRAWRDQHSDRVILTHDEYEKVTGVQRAFLAKPRARQSLEQCHHRESSVFWPCPETGLPLKGRPDWFDLDCVYDLKVSIDADKEHGHMVYRAHANGWFNQLAHNRLGLCALGYPIDLGRLVIVSPNPPHNVHLIEVRENDMDFLELDNLNTRRGMAACHESGKWPGTPDQWAAIELPMSATFTESDLQGAVEA